MPCFHCKIQWGRRRFSVLESSWGKLVISCFGDYPSVLYFQITTMQLEREKALEHKNRMSRMLEDRDLFVMRLKAARQSVYEVSSLFCLWKS